MLVKQTIYYFVINMIKNIIKKWKTIYKKQNINDKKILLKMLLWEIKYIKIENDFYLPVDIWDLWVDSLKDLINLNTPKKADIRVCKQCWWEYEYWIESLRWKYCSSTCATKRNNRDWKKNYGEKYRKLRKKPDVEKVCRACIKTYKTAKPLQIFCSNECSEDYSVFYDLEKRKCRLCWNKFIGKKRNNFCSNDCRLRWIMAVNRRNSEKKFKKEYKDIEYYLHYMKGKPISIWLIKNHKWIRIDETIKRYKELYNKYKQYFK